MLTPRFLAVNYCHDVVCPSIAALPSFLVNTEYRNPTNLAHCPFQKAFLTDDVFFDWFPKHPEVLQDFTLWMTAQRQGRTTWLDFFPFEEQLTKEFKGSRDAEKVILVDVGGGIGHEIEEIKKRYPQVEGKFVLQDLPDTLRQALPVPGMQIMSHDFFTPQPVKGKPDLCITIHD